MVLIIRIYGPYLVLIFLKSGPYLVLNKYFFLEGLVFPTLPLSERESSQRIGKKVTSSVFIKVKVALLSAKITMRRNINTE